MEKYVISFHYSSKSNGILHKSYEVEAKSDIHAQAKGMALSDAYIRKYNANSDDDKIIKIISIIQYN